MDREIVKEYKNTDVIVVWKPSLCIHAAECVKALPQVYNPNEKPWIKIGNATGEELRAQVAKCPSGALSIKTDADSGNTNNPSSEITIMPNGPILIKGQIELKDKKGELSKKEGVTAFCRCGASANKPFCDGTHHKVEFKDE